MFAFLARLLPRIRRQDVVGGLYSVDSLDGTFTVAKVLIADWKGVHIRLYKNRFHARPKELDPEALELGTIDDPDPGIGHLPITWRLWRSWFPSLLSTNSVDEEELEGYRYWQDESDCQYFDITSLDDIDSPLT